MKKGAVIAALFSSLLAAEPAAVNLQKEWSPFIDASFIYWLVEEDGLQLAQSAILSQGSQVMSPDTKFAEFSFGYSPGFKVAVGATYDKEWNMKVQYTYLHGSRTFEKEPPDNESDIPGFSVWNVNDWFVQTATFSQLNSPQAQSLSATKIRADWKLDLNVIDASVERPSYIGTSFVVIPFAGIRSVWITQSVKVALFQPAAAVGGAQYLSPQPILSKTQSKNFSIGPLIGCEANYLLPLGWRITAHGAASLLATRSTTLQHTEDAQSVAVSEGPYVINHAHYHGVLPNAEIGLGFGWGKYLGNGRYYLDFAASYDFIIFWAQNVLRQMLDEAWNGTGSTAGNLSFNGLTLNAHLSF